MGSPSLEISASVYAADPLHIGKACKEVEPHVDSFHFDIMDGAFAPAFGLNLSLLQALIDVIDKPLDVHLMVNEPDAWIEPVSRFAVRSIAVHIEAKCSHSLIAKVTEQNGVLPVIAIKPETRLETLDPVLGQYRGILTMTAPPGGGDFDQQAFSRIEKISKNHTIFVDGQIRHMMLAECQRMGANTVVMGRALFALETPHMSLRP